jgi:hypothetical protein
MSFNTQPDEGLSLDALLATLNGMTKAAEDSSEEKKDLPAFMQKKDGDEKKEPSDEKKDGDKKDDEKKESSDEKKDGDGQTKEAAARAGADLAKEVLAKFASTQVTQIEPMNKQASVAGQALAHALLKQAGNGDMTTTNGVTPGSVPQKTTVDNAALEAEGASYIKPMPTGNGVVNTGTLNEIFDAIVADAASQGAAGVDQVHQTGVASQEGAVEDHALPNQVKVAYMNELLAQGVDFEEALELTKEAADAQAADEMEKSAAVQELVNRGESFEDAVALVKMAAAEIETEMEKAAALNELLAEGIDFDSAVALIKEAGDGDLTTQDGVTPGSAPQKTTMDNAAMTAEGDSAIKPMPTGDGIRNGGTLNQIFDGIVADAMSQGAAGVDQVHQTGVASQEGAVEDHAVPNQVKIACMNELLAQGLDFDEAAAMMKSAGRGGNFLIEQGTNLMNNMSYAAPKFGEAFERATRRTGAHLGGAIRSTGSGLNRAQRYVEDGAAAVSEAASNAKNKAVAGVKDVGHAAQVAALRAKRNAQVAVGRGGQAAKAYAQAHPYATGAAAAGLGAAALGGGAYALSEKKAAYMNELLAQGVDFDEAAELVKEAGVPGNFLIQKGTDLMNHMSHIAPAVGDKVTYAVRNTGGYTGGVIRSAGSGMNRAQRALEDGAAAVGEAASNAKNKVVAGVKDAGHAAQVAALRARRNAQVAVGRGGQAVKSYAQAHPYATGAAAGLGAAALGGGAIALAREKKAAFDALVEGGVDFETAAQLVSQKAQELYGE